jgi:hypothetical protein
VHGFWPIFFLLVVLKIPVFSALWLVWWASRATPEADGAAEDSDGGFGRWRPLRPRSRGPHGGPHGGLVSRRVRARPAELVSDHRERVPADGCEPSPTRPRQAG